MRALVLSMALVTHATHGWPNALHATITDNAGGPVADAVVALIPEHAGSVPVAAVGTQASIDQVNREFRPHVLAIQVGTLVSFPNSDNIRHQVYSFSEAKRFETKLYAGRTAPPVLFDKPGVVVLGCNIHDEMSAYVYVLDTPYFATTDADGRALLTVPAGHYQVSIWHPRHALGRTPIRTDTDVTDADQSLQQRIELDAASETVSPRSLEH